MPLYSWGLGGNSSSEGLAGNQPGWRDTENTARKQPQGLLNDSASFPGWKGWRGLGRGSTQQRRHLWLVQGPHTSIPESGHGEETGWLPRAPLRSGLGLLPSSTGAQPQPLCSPGCCLIHPCSLSGTHGGPVVAGVVPTAGDGSTSHTPLCPFTKHSIRATLWTCWEADVMAQ